MPRPDAYVPPARWVSHIYEAAVEATVSANVGGLIATLYAFSALSFEFESVEVFAERFHQLREFALEHTDAALILAAID